MKAPAGPYELRYTRAGNSEQDVLFKEVLEYFYHCRRGNGDNMACHIFRCLQKADGYHMDCFYKGFPEYVVIHEMWQRASSEKQFFESRGFVWRD